MRVDLFGAAHGIIAGQVIDGGNEMPVEGADVDIMIRDSDCVGGKAHASRVTGPEGDYQLNFAPVNTGVFESCIEITVTPPEDAGLASADTSGIRLDVVSVDQEPDTAFVDFTLPRR